MKDFVLCVSEGISLWVLMTRENYTSMVRDARKVWRFDGCNGFSSTNDVLSYINRYFGIASNNIELV